MRDGGITCHPSYRTLLLNRVSLTGLPCPPVFTVYLLLHAGPQDSNHHGIMGQVRVLNFLLASMTIPCCLDERELEAINLYT